MVGCDRKLEEKERRVRRAFCGGREYEGTGGGEGGQSCGGHGEGGSSADVGGWENEGEDLRGEVV